MDLKKIVSSCAPAQLLAVSKLQPEDKIRSLYLQGQRNFGENYVQEAIEKQSHLQDLRDIHWHFIGHLQKNKAKFVVGQFDLIHSVDSLSLAKVVSHQAIQKGVNQNILIQVNLAGEESKGGFDPSNLMQQWMELTSYPQIHICGFMTMPPLTESGEEVRPYFKALKKLMETLRQNTDLTQHPMNELSMGTSHDFQVAVQEGATIVRLGTILFGERPSKKVE